MESFPNQSNLEKQNHWQEILKNLDRITDGLGKPIEEGIKETITGLNVNNIPTTNSCAGHIEENRLSFPYVGGSAEEKPKYRYEGEEEIFERLVAEHNLSSQHEVFDNGEVEKEYYSLTENLPEADDYKTWYVKNISLRENVGHLLDEFNATRAATKIHLSPIYPGYRIEAHDREEEKITERDIQLAREEFDAFADFLKQKYFAE